MYVYIYIYIIIGPDPWRERERERERERDLQSANVWDLGDLEVDFSTPNSRYKILVFLDPTLGKYYATTYKTKGFLGNPTLGENIVT